VAELDVYVVSPERQIFEGKAQMVIAKGIAGDVGILPQHAPMLVALAIHPVRIIEESGERLILVDGGFLHVSTDEEGTRVDILAEHASLPDEIDASAARARVDELRRRTEDGGEVKAQAELEKALMRAEHGRG
jgi:F-type H+-transporting ATPase subunit epsilon